MLRPLGLLCVLFLRLCECRFCMGQLAAHLLLLLVRLVDLGEWSGTGVWDRS